MNTVEQEEKEEDPDEEERQERIKRMPILEQCFNLMDFEAVARRVMKKAAWAYYSSGADDEIVSEHPLSIVQEDVLIDANGLRRCERITPRTTRSGFGREFYMM